MLLTANTVVLRQGLGVWLSKSRESFMCNSLSRSSGATPTHPSPFAALC